MQTRSSTTYDRGAVVHIPFRFTAGEKAKRRPGVVISSRAFNESRRDVVVAGLTTNLSRDHFVGYLVLADWADSGLPRPSAVSGIVQTIREDQILERIGALSSRDQVHLDETLREVLGL
jgi:mRNA interferase MazF